ncbi:hypothetical protein LSAT2_021523, partial [Lamellibrachia satsuma]
SIFSAVTFRQFVANLLTTLSTMTELSHIRRDLLEMTRRYDDCMKACEIPFTKRDQREEFVVYFWHRFYTRYNSGKLATDVVYPTAAFLSVVKAL